MIRVFRLLSSSSSVSQPNAFSSLVAPAVRATGNCVSLRRYHSSTRTTGADTKGTSHSEQKSFTTGTRSDNGSKSAHSWGFVDVDSSGKTDMDYRHEAAVERVRGRFSDPIILPNEDRSIDGPSDFLVGFAQYRWSLRDSYRTAICMALNEILLKQLNNNNSNSGSSSLEKISSSQLDLSVAWTGQFALNKFRGVHKVLGVTLLEPAENQPSQQEQQQQQQCEKKNLTSAEVKYRRLADSPHKHELIGDFATLVNDQKTKCLVEVGIVRAVPRDITSSSAATGDPAASQIDKDDFEAASRAVLKEIKNLSQRQHVVFVYSDLTEAECREKLRPIIFAQRVSPVLVNIDDIGRRGEKEGSVGEDVSTATATTPLDDDDGQSESAFPSCLPRALFDASERRRIVLHALGQQYKRSLLDEASLSSSERNGSKADSTDDSANAPQQQQQKQLLRLPMIFINGAYLGTTRHLLRMGNEARKLNTLIHRPSDLKMKKPI